MAKFEGIAFIHLLTHSFIHSFLPHYRRPPHQSLPLLFLLEKSSQDQYWDQSAADNGSENQTSSH